MRDFWETLQRLLCSLVSGDYSLQRRHSEVDLTEDKCTVGDYPLRSHGSR